MYKWPAEDLVNGPTTSRPHASNGQETIVRCKGSVRSSHEFEPEWLKLLQEIQQKVIIPARYPHPMLNFRDYDDNEEWKAMKEWLDKQSKGSVVYVAFGSEAKPSQAEVTEIALGLELSELPFFRALRMRCCLVDIDIVELPDGFEDKMKGCRVV
ncbi:UDP-glycosyltransferase 91A1-like [Camellia sinensis]|uniref:UDP-glycosyltransferase 91A1-like n=1 Tax=Camellia sinensis TaxID=4442 RepID=UPI00103680EB|nr:UDP-glycosyltransferase 91A1-like [Camellia sinensis]